MRSLSTVGLALSLVFGCLLLALVAELYYLLWWKNRAFRRDIHDNDDYIINPSRELFHKFCFEKPLFFSANSLNPQQVCSSTLTHEPQTLVENEFMRLTPRFLYTIQEETKEDLELEEGKRSRKASSGRISLSDVIFVDENETPFMTPIASPPYYTPPLTPLDTTYKHHGFNPLFESSNEAEFCKLRSSPPPIFKFLKDAEDKLQRKKLMEKAKSSLFLKDEKTGSFITLIVDKDTEKEKELNLYDKF